MLEIIVAIAIYLVLSFLLACFIGMWIKAGRAGK
jgi:hypothetical protein